MLLIPDITLSISKNNFVFKSSTLWNELIDCILEKSLPNKKGIIVRDSSLNSDLYATIPFVKNKLKALLLDHQSSGDGLEWVS